jgi:hypothetical protein
MHQLVRMVTVIDVSGRTFGEQLVHAKHDPTIA